MSSASSAVIPAKLPIGPDGIGRQSVAPTSSTPLVIARATASGFHPAIPLGWGVYQSLVKALPLFRSVSAK